jgi:hypothetical protein
MKLLFSSLSPKVRFETGVLASEIAGFQTARLMTSSWFRQTAISKVC